MSFVRPLCLLLLAASVTALYTPHIDRELYDQTPSKRDFQAQNAKDAQKLNTKFATLTADSSCDNEGDVACIGEDFAMCTQGKFVLMSCGPSLQCYALPLVNKAGTTVTCDTKEDAFARLGASEGSEPPSTSASASSSASSATTSVASTSTVSSETSTKITTTISVPTTSATSSHVTSSSSAQSTRVTKTFTTSSSASTHSTTSARRTSTISASASLPSSPLSVLTGIQTGQATYYDTGLTACGGTYTDDQPIVAVSHILFDEFPGYNGQNPNTNPICGKQVRATYEGRSVTATIVDRCTACAETDLDFTPSLYKQLDPKGTLDSGRLFGMTWEWL